MIATFITQSDVAQREKKEKDSFQKRPSYKGDSKGQKFDNKNNKSNNFHNKNNKNRFNKNKNDNTGAKGRGNRNDHVIRIVSDATPSTSNDSNAQSNDEQVFRLAPS